MKFSIKDFFSKCDQIRRLIWSHLMKKFLAENLIFSAVLNCPYPIRSNLITIKIPPYSYSTFFSFKQCLCSQ